MSAAQNIKAGRAFVEVAGNLSPLQKDLAKGQAMLRTWGTSLNSIGISVSNLWAGLAGSAVVGALSGAVKTFVDIGSALNDMSGRTGIAARELIDLTFAAKQTGATAQDLEQAARAMVRNGFDVSKLAEIGQSIADIQDPTERSARAMEVFGKSGTKLIPMFTELKSLRAASAALGPMLSDEDIATADKLGDSFSAMGEAASRAAQQIGKKLAPELQHTLNLWTGILVAFSEWSSKSGTLEQDQSIVDPNGFFTKLRKRGADINEGASTQAAAAEAEEGLLTSRKKLEQQAAKVADEAGRRRVAFQQQVNSLIQESLTPQERFLQQQREIIQAMVGLNALMASGMFDPRLLNAQNAQLRTALDGLRTAESKRLAEPQLEVEKERLALLKSQLNEREKQLLAEQEVQKSIQQAKQSGAGLTTVGALSEVLRRVREAGDSFRSSSKGTFSAAGASMLGRGGGAAEREQQVHTGLLKKIEEHTRKFEAAKFS